MSTPFDPDRWPAGYGPGSSGASGAGGGGGDEPPLFNDEDGLSADPSTGKVLPSGPEDPAAAPPRKPKPDPREAFLQWVSEQIGQVEAYQQPIAQKSAWCPEWWKHPEVVQRLYVAWKAYQQAVERMSEDKGAKSAWWVQHWDHHARILFDKQHGPFRACNQAGHLADNDGRPLPIVVELPPDEAPLI
ncbi:MULTISPECIES: DUF4913 domain-containing protein [unclassified Curtobacterium]|uniref:DUF4913 domain-containing protein n=1 Tax=unclassified Curtobacterium TaxID=257496 RepID=UPI00226B1255|nr:MULTISPECIES: DUF4913 domain-containing protein [unclassified Curtobacterium]